MKHEFKIGQTVELKSGYTGVIISISNRGNGDIRPPYHKEGQPTLKPVGGYLGYLTIIPDEWEKLYDGEVNENEIKVIN